MDLIKIFGYNRRLRYLKIYFWLNLFLHPLYVRLDETRKFTSEITCQIVLVIFDRSYCLFCVARFYKKKYIFAFIFKRFLSFLSNEYSKWVKVFSSIKIINVMTTSRVIRGTRAKIFLYICGILIITGIIACYNNTLSQLDETRKSYENCRQHEENLSTQLQGNRAKQYRWGY